MRFLFWEKWAITPSMPLSALNLPCEGMRAGVVEVDYLLIARGKCLDCPIENRAGFAGEGRLVAV